MTGLDTGYFIALLQGHREAEALWHSALNEAEVLVVSCLSLFEIERLGLKGAVADARTIMEAIQAATEVVWPDAEILSRAARISHGTHIPAIDSIILASLLSQEVSVIFTTDADLCRYTVRDLKIINLRTQ